MQVTLNTYNYNSTPNFTSLKKVEGGKLLSCLIKEDGYAIEDEIVSNMKKSRTFQSLCKKYNVFVRISPFVTDSQGLLVGKGLSLKILASEIRKGVFAGLFKKSAPKNVVANYSAVGSGERTWKLADNMIDSYICSEKGMKADISKFLDEESKTAHNT